MSVVVVLIVINLIIAAIPATIATNKDKNRSFGLWYIYGFFLFLIALIHSLCISNRNELEPEIIKTNTLKNQSFRWTGSSRDSLLSLPTMHRVAAWRRKNSWKGDAGKFCSWLIQTR